MPIKDFIQQEIEKIGALLQYLIGKYVPSKTLEEQQQTEELFNKILEEQYGNGLEYILNLPEKDFDKEFTKNKGFNDANIELLADLLFTLGNDEYSKNMKYLNKAMSLYQYIDFSTKTFSLERSSKINILKEIL